MRMMKKKNCDVTHCKNGPNSNKYDMWELKFQIIWIIVKKKWFENMRDLKISWVFKISDDIAHLIVHISKMLLSIQNK